MKYHLLDFACQLDALSHCDQGRLVAVLESITMNPSADIPIAERQNAQQLLDGLRALVSERGTDGLAEAAARLRRRAAN